MTSLSAKIVNIILRLRGIKKIFESEQGALKGVAENRKNGPAKPHSALHSLCDISEEKVDGHLVYHLTPKSGGSDHHVLYFHGGGYAIDIVPEHWKYIAKLIKQTGASVTVPIYPLAPEHDWKPAYAMAAKIYAGLVTETEAKHICFMGDSAGGGFSLALAQMLRDEGQPLPGRIVLLSPWLNGLGDDPEQLEIDRRDHIIGIGGIKAMGRWWAGEGGDPAAFPISPINHDITGLPPMAMWSGTNDILYVDAKQLDAKAKADGASLETHIWPDMQHVWMILPMKEADQAVAEIAAFMAKA
ncbi:MAG: alpha/beta hydrolase [Pseudomonadota bacterium]